jgi:hypothetical protein
MPRQKQTIKKSGKSGFVLGRASFGKISAVEGIRLTTAAKKRAADAKAKGLSADEYREAVVRAHRKG